MLEILHGCRGDSILLQCSVPSAKHPWIVELSRPPRTGQTLEQEHQAEACHPCLLTLAAARQDGLHVLQKSLVDVLAEHAEVDLQLAVRQAW